MQNSGVRLKISELEKEAEKLDKIKNRFDETLRKSVKLAKFNYQNDNSELGVLDSHFNSQLQSITVSHAVSPAKREDPKPVDESELIEEDAENEPLQF